MEDVGLQWNPKKCEVVHVQSGVQTHTHDASRQEANQYRFLGVLETVRQEEKMSLMSLECHGSQPCNSIEPICITSVRLPNMDTTMAVYRAQKCYIEEHAR